MKDSEKEEFRKCQESPAYFYNKYCKPPGAADLTDEDMKGLITYPRGRRSQGQTSRNAKYLAMSSQMGKKCVIATLTQESYDKFLTLYLEFGGDPELISRVPPKSEMTGLRMNFERDLDYPEETIESVWPTMPDIPGKAIITSHQTILNGNKFRDLWNEADPKNKDL